MAPGSATITAFLFSVFLLSPGGWGLVRETLVPRPVIRGLADETPATP
jgi:hypothetical protein